MAMLERMDTRDRIMLRARHLVGRSRIAHLRLREANVSGEHAVLLWTGSQWEVHDLGSRNGTFVDGHRLDTGGRAGLRRGGTIGFGSAGNLWRLIDDGPPRAMAVLVGGQEGDQEGKEADGDGRIQRGAEGGFLALPDAGEPELTIYRGRDGDWMMEGDGAAEHVADGSEVVAGGRRFLLYLPETLAATWEVGVTAPRLDVATLRFAVSSDEEYVRLALLYRDDEIDLGARVHHYVLLTLARVRLRDREAGTPASDQGWVYQDELSRMLDMDDKHVNVAVFRSRQQLGAAGVLGAAGIVERRKPTRQIRLGLDRVEIVRL